MRTTGFSLRPPDFTQAQATAAAAGGSSSATSSALSSAVSTSLVAGAHAGRPAVLRRASSGASLPSLPNLSLLDSAEKNEPSLQGAMWNQRFRKRVEDKSKRREESAKRRRALREREKERGGGGGAQAGGSTLMTAGLPQDDEEAVDDSEDSDGEDEQVSRAHTFGREVHFESKGLTDTHTHTLRRPAIVRVVVRRRADIRSDDGSRRTTSSTCRNGVV